MNANHKAITVRGGPLSGITVIEMSGLAPGPFCAMMLADMGARVLRIHRPGETVGNDPSYVLNRSRKTIAVDLKSAEGKQLLRRLLQQADAFIEGFRPGVMERLGLGPDECLNLNPRLVYGRMTGWGQEGPLAQAAGHDINYIALTGVLHSIGPKGGAPVPPLNLVGDFGGGGMYLAFGLVCALLETARSGKGQVVDAAMIDGAASLMAYVYGLRASGEWSDARGENLLDGASPWYRAYRTSDGHYISIAASEPQFYSQLLRLTGLDRDTHLADRSDRAQWPALEARFAEVFAGKTRAQWCELLEGSDACFAPVLDLAEAVSHPHNRARGTFVEVDGVVQPAPAPRFSRSKPTAPFAPVASGVDDEAVLAEWGFSEEEVRSLRRSGGLR